MMMHLLKQIPVIALAAIVMAASAMPAFALEKKAKDPKAGQKVEQKTSASSQAKKSDSKKPAVKSSSGHKKSLSNRPAPHRQTVTPKRFDKFLDKNKNGIDDRKENLREKKPVVNKDTTKKPVEKKK